MDFKFDFKAFIRRFQFEYVYNVLKEAFIRFPLSVLCATGATLTSISDTHDLSWLTDDTIYRLMTFFANGLALFTAASLYAESIGLAKTRKWGLMAVGSGTAAAFAVIPDHFTSAQLFFGFAVSLTMLFAPYIGRKSSEESLWQFNYLNGVGLAIAGVSTFVLCAGLSAVIGSMNYLFPILDVPGRLYGDIWIFGAFFFGPVAFMYQIPRQFDYLAMDCEMPKGISFIANFLVVPLVLIYTFILYVYSAKIVALWELPKGNLAYLVTGFGAAGVAARLAVFPMRHTGTILLQQFYKYFPYLLLVPLALLSLGIYTRISQYGVTEERYAIALCLVWLAGLTAWQIARPRAQHIKQVPMALAALMFVASFGPWSAVPVSENSQLARLEGLLQVAGVKTPAGSYVPVKGEIAFETRKELSSVLDYFYEDQKNGKIAHIEAPFIVAMKAKNKDYDIDDATRCGKRSFTRCWSYYGRAQRLMEAMGLRYVSRYDTEGTNDDFTTHANTLDWNIDQLTRIAPYDYIVRFWAYSYNQTDWTTVRTFREGGKDILTVNFNMSLAGVFTVSTTDGRTVSFDLMPVLAGLYAENKTDIQESETARMMLTAESRGLRVALRIGELRGKIVAGKLNFEGAQVTVLLSP
ncbi:MAG: DUF4153 domain-containing protein [bacterium]|nr:DUF4153 domain-containing protein [bacterium]